MSMNAKIIDFFIHFGVHWVLKLRTHKERYLIALLIEVFTIDIRFWFWPRRNRYKSLKDCKELGGYFTHYLGKSANNSQLVFSIHFYSISVAHLMFMKALGKFTGDLASDCMKSTPSCKD